MKIFTPGSSIIHFKQRLAVRVFCALLALVILPLYFAAAYVRSRYESYFRTELNRNITSTLAKNEIQIEQLFDNLGNIANIYCTDDGLKAALSDGNRTYYEKAKAFDKVTDTIEVNNLSPMDNVQVTIEDAAGQLYTNWSMNFHDYSFLKDSPVFNSESLKKGYPEWSMFCDPFIYGDAPDNKYVGISRGILAVSTKADARYLATAFVSIRKSELSKFLEQFRYAGGDYISVFDTNGNQFLYDSADDEPHPNLDAAARKWIETGEEVQTVRSSAGGTYLVCRYDVSQKWIGGNRDLYIFHFTDEAPVAAKVRSISGMMNGILIMCLILVTLVVGGISWALIHPIHVLADTMSHYELAKQYDFSDSSRKDEIGQLNRAFGDMDARVKKLFSDLIRENKVKEQYKLDCLKAQMNPHFLFNTLGTIRWMAIAQHMTNMVECIDALGNMLNYSMNQGDEMITLHEEIKNLEDYIKIQNYRYGNRYRIVSRIGSAEENCLIIRFLLQPVIENAVLHAFSEGEGEIIISAAADGDVLEVVIADNGKGISADILEKINSGTYVQGESITKWQFNKIGIYNIQEQIKIRYGDAYGLHFESDGCHGTKCIYRLPVQIRR